MSVIRADFQSTYLLRYLLLGGAFLFMSLWFLYDGIVGYPSKLPIAKAFDEILEMEPARRAEAWEKITTERGWPRETPKKRAEQIEGDILGQYVFSGLCALVAIPAIIFLLRSRGTWVEATEDRITTSWGQSLNFADVTRLDKKKWAEKGIAKATYNSGSGTKVFVFDDFKYSRESLGKILRALESVLARDQIVGGPTEVEADAQREAEEREQELDDDQEELDGQNDREEPTDKNK